MISQLILIVFIMLVLDSVVSASEAAIFSVPIAKIKYRAQNSRSARALLFLKESMEAPIVTLISLSNLITIMGSVIACIIAADIFGEWWVGLFAAVLTFLIMIVAEIIPKRIGERYDLPVALFVAAPLRAVSWLFSPITWLIEKITSPLAGNKKQTVSREELEFLAVLGKREGVIDEYESQLIDRVFKLESITAGDIMTPKPFVFSLDGNKLLQDVQEEIKRVARSQIPIYEGRDDAIVGFVHQRELLCALADDKYDVKVKRYVHKPLVVPESRLGDDLLRDFLRARLRLTVVVSDYAHMVGVVGLEDVLEELVGEIAGEEGSARQTITRVTSNEILVHRQAHVHEINKFFNTNIKSKKTLNGFLLRRLGHLPASGDAITIGSVVLAVEDTSASSIEQVRIRRV